jgi:prevent-host-death family protein
MSSCRFQVCVVEKTITAAEADRDFSRLLREVRGGESYVVTEDGRPVARIEPALSAVEGREAAKRRLLEHLRAQPTLNLGRFSRDDAYDD